MPDLRRLRLVERGMLVMALDTRKDRQNPYEIRNGKVAARAVETRQAAEIISIDDAANQAVAATGTIWGPIERPWASDPCKGAFPLSAWFKRFWQINPHSALKVKP